jgi:hypothetical protein
MAGGNRQAQQEGPGSEATDTASSKVTGAPVYTTFWKPRGESE